MKFIKMLFVFFPAIIFGQEIFHSEFRNNESSYENFNDLNSYKTFRQILLYGNEHFIWESEVFEKRNGKKNIIRCYNSEGTWSVKNDTITVVFNEDRSMKFKIDSNRKKMTDIDEDLRFSKKSRFKKVAKKKILICNSKNETKPTL